MRGIFSPVEKDVIVINNENQKIIDKTVDKIENIFIELIKRVDKIQLNDKSKDENIKLKILSELVVGIFNFPMMIGYVNLSESKANERGNEPILNSFNYLITYVLKRHLDPDLSGKIYSADGGLETIEQ